MSINDFATTQFTRNDFLQTFGCAEMETQVLHIVNSAIAKGQLPVFKDEDFHCICRDPFIGECHWTAEKVRNRLVQKGLWTAIETKVLCQRQHAG